MPCQLWAQSFFLSRWKLIGLRRNNLFVHVSPWFFAWNLLDSSDSCSCNIHIYARESISCADKQKVAPLISSLCKRWRDSSFSFHTPKTYSTVVTPSQLSSIVCSIFCLERQANWSSSKHRVTHQKTSLLQHFLDWIAKNICIPCLTEWWVMMMMSWDKLQKRWNTL